VLWTQFVKEASANSAELAESSCQVSDNTVGRRVVFVIVVF